MTQRIAEQDITEKNALGQDVVVVPAGQPIPEGFDSASTGLRATEAAANGVSDGITAPSVPLTAETFLAGVYGFVRQFGELPEEDRTELLEELLDTADNEALQTVYGKLEEELRDRELLEDGGEPAGLPDGVVPGETPGWPIEAKSGELLPLEVQQRTALAAKGLSGSFEAEDVEAFIGGEVEHEPPADEAAADKGTTSKPKSTGKRAGAKKG